MANRRLYEIIGIACGLILLNYGFNLLASGFPGTRQLTSQFLGVNLLIGGSVAVFISLYFLLKLPVQVTPVAQPAGSAPDVGVELVVEEEPPSQYGFYKNIEYVGYFFTAVGLFSAVDLVLQVLIPVLYNETRWWVEVLLATFGVLSYAIFGSIGRLGAQEERKYVLRSELRTPNSGTAQAETSQMPSPAYPEILHVDISEFSKSASSEYERQLAPGVYDVFRIERETVTVWRENREGMRSVYLAGPYELSRKLLEEYVVRGEELRIGYLFLPLDALRDLVRLQEHRAEELQAAAG